MWIEELDDANLSSGKPRSHLLPYSAPLAVQAAAAQAEIRKGNPHGGMATTWGTCLGQMPPAGEVAPHEVSAGGGLLDPE